ncbi:hypothetical protein [Enterobacter bugandensis]|uniref:hypothetical protein n=1 Tax=Enterobacter bugandensis TaxID=881260 RepID=UPI00168177E9|nr:hypothetical protein [Enterobacter bugandensis]
MSTITKEWLQQKIADMEATRDEIPFGLDEGDSNTLEALCMALASLEAEAVAWIVHARTGDQLTTDGGYVANAEGILGLHSTPLYAAPPKLIVPEEAVKVARAALDYIDALPPDVVASLPAMPGFDRDWAENVLAEAVPKEVGKCT